MRLPFSLLLVGTFAVAAPRALPQKLQQLVAESDGRIGICVLDLADEKPACVHGDQKFQLQSVMKLVVAAAIFDAVDHGLMKLDDRITVRPEDASPGPQEFADLVKSKGSLPTALEELVRRAVVDSDSTSVDLLVKHLGGPAVVQKTVDRIHLKGLRIDRDERHVQSDSVGLRWRDEFFDSAKFEAAVQAVPDAEREGAWRAHLVDSRDTSTPVAMVTFLKALATGKLLSESSTQKLLNVMKMTLTGPDRLAAGLPKGWRLAHKTGTGRTWKGMNAATNDVGILYGPAGRTLAVAVFVTESTKSNEVRAAVIAKAAKLATASP